MAQPTQQFTIRGNAFQGLNTEMSPIGSDPSYALTADNCVIDRVGRISAREAFAPETPIEISSIYSDIDITAISANYDVDGIEYTPSPVCTLLMGSYLPFTKSKPTDTEPKPFSIDPNEPHTYSLGYSDGLRVKECTYPALDNDGLSRSVYVHFNDKLYLFSRNNPYLVYEDPGKWSEVAHTPPQDDDGNIADKINGDIAISAYGRLWVSGVDGDYHKIYYSSLLRDDQWYDGKGTPDDDQNTGGIIDVSEYWPVDFDHIVNIHAHNGMLIVFGRRSIILYANANGGDPAGENGIQLQDGISNVGLIERDAICNIGTDVVFCDDTGLRSLGRSIQEKSNPMGEPSMNIKREFMDMIDREHRSTEMTKGIKLAYIPSKSLVVALFSSSSVAYTFSTERPSTSGGAKVTRWTDCYFTSMYFAENTEEGKPYLGGRKNRGVLLYDGYRSEDPYLFNFESMALGVTGDRVQEAIPKSIIYLVLAPPVNAPAISKWGFDGYLQYTQPFDIKAQGTTEWGIAEFAVGEYVGGATGVWKSKVNTMGAGNFMRVGLELEINGNSFAVQEIAVNTAIGRLMA